MRCCTDQKWGIANISFGNYKRQTLIRPRLVFPSVDAFFILAFWILSIKLVTWLATLSVRHSLGGGFVARLKKGARQKKICFVENAGEKFSKRNDACVKGNKRVFHPRVSRQVGATCTFEKMQTFDVSTGKARGFLPLYFPSFDLINEIDCPEPAGYSSTSVCHFARQLFFQRAATANYGKHVCVSSGCLYQRNFEQERPGRAISNGRWCICSVGAGGSSDRFARDVSEKPDGFVKYVKRNVKLSRWLPDVAGNVSRVTCCVRLRYFSFLLTITRARAQFCKTRAFCVSRVFATKIIWRRAWNFGDFLFLAASNVDISVTRKMAFA